MAEVNFYPKPEGRLITVSRAYDSVINDESERLALLAAGLKYAVYRDWEDMKPGENGRFGDFYKLHPGRPARTLTKNLGHDHCRGVMDWREKRRPTTAEAKRLGSYPDQFRFRGTFKDRGECIGNSVPPLFMRAVARHLGNILPQSPE